MSHARIVAVALTPTHDGEAAMVIHLAFPDGGQIKVQVDPDNIAKVLAKAEAASIHDLIGKPWWVIDVGNPLFDASARVARDYWASRPE